ncbi:MAG: 2OG-Fe(II) oxygenase [Halioglobus sp.]
MQNKIYVNSYQFDANLACYCASEALFNDCCGNHAPDRKIPNGIVIVKDFLSRAQCQSFIRFADKQKRAWLMINDEEKSTEKKVVGKRDPSRVTQHVDIGKKQTLVEDWIRSAVSNCVQPIMGKRAQWFEQPQLLRYGPGGRYTAHSDADHFDYDASQYFRAIDRDFSLLIYLNDDYEGGGLRFIGQDYTYQPEAGSLVFFPSNNMYTHESLPITRGKKYALVSWGAAMGSARVSARPNYRVITV